MMKCTTMFEMQVYRKIHFDTNVMKKKRIIFRCNFDI